MKTKKKEKWVVVFEDGNGGFYVPNFGFFRCRQAAEDWAEHYKRPAYIAKLEEVE